MGATLLVVLFSSFVAAAVADDWVAVKLRGGVFAYTGGDWAQLKRGAVVPDDQLIRTQGNGHVQFQREAETIDLGPNTQIQIIDRPGKRFTTVKQYYGMVTIEAEVQNVQHFAVKTPFLAAVVKGTRFVVVSGEDSSKVQVKRGQVAVEDIGTHHSVEIVAGQSVTASPNSEMDVSGTGKLPVVLDALGNPVAVAAVGKRNAGVGNSGIGNGNGGGDGSNGGGNGNGNSGNGNGNGGGDGSNAGGNGNGKP